MFRILQAHSLVHTKCLIYRRQTVNIQVLSVSHHGEPKIQPGDVCRERDPCPPELPKPKPRDDRWLWGTLFMMVCAGGFIAYAKENPELRDWLSINVPWLDDIIALAHQENQTYEEIAADCLESIKDKWDEYIARAPPRECPPCEDLDEDKVEPEGDISVAHEKEYPKDLCSLEDCLKDISLDIYHNYMTGRDACILYNKDVDDTMTRFTMAKLRALPAAAAERTGLVDESMDNIKDAPQELVALTRFLDCDLSDVPKEKKDNTHALLKQLDAKNKPMIAQYMAEKDKAEANDRLVQKMEGTMGKYTHETTILFPEVDYDAKKPTLTGDPDLLIHHTLKTERALQEDLDSARLSMRDRADQAFETLPADTPEEKKKLDDKLKQEMNKVQKENTDAYNKECANQKQNNDKRYKEELAKQQEDFKEETIRKLAEKEIEATEKLNEMVADKLAAEKAVFAKQKAEMGAKLQEMEDKLAEHLKAERETKRSQALWQAGSSLLEATQRGAPRVRVDREIRAVEKASHEEDKLVKTVISSIPETVRENGIVPESVLKNNYESMEKTAMKVALVEAEGNCLPVYLLSWFQSRLLCMRVLGIPQSEVEDPPKEPFTGLDTFDKLHRARYWLNRGNMAQAVRYVDSLEGASRVAAKTWYDEAKDHVEIKQAAEALKAHAASLGLQYV